MSKIKDFIFGSKETEEPVDFSDTNEGTETTETTKGNESSNNNLVLKKPEERTELAEIATELMKRRIVILNLELIDKSEERRFIDFLQGTIFALNGQTRKLSEDTYLFIPGGSEVYGEILDDIEKII